MKHSLITLFLLTWLSMDAQIIPNTAFLDHGNQAFITEIEAFQDGYLFSQTNASSFFSGSGIYFWSKDRGVVPLFSGNEFLMDIIVIDDHRWQALIYYCLEFDIHCPLFLLNGNDLEIESKTELPDVNSCFGYFNSAIDQEENLYKLEYSYSQQINSLIKYQDGEEISTPLSRTENQLFNNNQNKIFLLSDNILSEVIDIDEIVLLEEFDAMTMIRYGNFMHQFGVLTEDKFSIYENDFSIKLHQLNIEIPFADIVDFSFNEEWIVFLMDQNVHAINRVTSDTKSWNIDSLTFNYNKIIGTKDGFTLGGNSNQNKVHSYISAIDFDPSSFQEIFPDISILNPTFELSIDQPENEGAYCGYNLQLNFKLKNEGEIAIDSVNVYTNDMILGNFPWENENILNLGFNEAILPGEEFSHTGLYEISGICQDDTEIILSVNGANLLPDYMTSDNLVMADLVSSTKQVPTHTAMKIFPNPTADFLKITHEEFILQVEIRNVNGDIVLKNRFDYSYNEEVKLDITFLNFGSYLLTVFDQSGDSQTMPFIKHK